MSVNQLLAKAMSTSSEEEAMSCLRMARKRGTVFEQASTSSSDYKGHDARYWYSKAEQYYDIAKKKQNDPPSGFLPLDQAKKLLELLESNEAARRNLVREKRVLADKISELESRGNTRSHFFWGGFFAGLMVAILPIVIYFS